MENKLVRRRRAGVLFTHAATALHTQELNIMIIATLGAFAGYIAFGGLSVAVVAIVERFSARRDVNQDGE